MIKQSIANQHNNLIKDFGMKYECNELEQNGIHGTKTHLLPYLLTLNDSEGVATN